MNELVSPRTSRLLAVGIFARALADDHRSGPCGFGSDIGRPRVDRLQQLAAELENRHLDIAALEQQLATTMSAPSLKGAVMTANTDRAALRRSPTGGPQFAGKDTWQAHVHFGSVEHARSAGDRRPSASAAGRIRDRRMAFRAGGGGTAGAGGERLVFASRGERQRCRRNRLVGRSAGTVDPTGKQEQ